MLPFIQIGLSVLLVISILMQRSGSSVGGAFGDASGSIHYARRGPEKLFFILTIIWAVLLVASVVYGLFL